jgi:hypothetical protein
MWTPCCCFLALPPTPAATGPASAAGYSAIPAGAIVAATTLAAYLQARAADLPPPAQQRTAAAIVTLTLSLAVLTRLAMPLTWRRILLVGAALAGFARCSRSNRYASSTHSTCRAASFQPHC